MSDSEEEAAFASADEGENTSKEEPEKKLESKSVKSETQKKAKEGVGTVQGESGKGSGSSTSTASGKEEGKKGGKAKQQQKQKKKGKGGSQAPSKDEPSKPVSKKASPREEAAEKHTQSMDMKSSGQGSKVKEGNSETAQNEEVAKASVKSSSSSSESKTPEKELPKLESVTAQEAHSTPEHSQTQEKEEESTEGSELSKKAGDVRRGLQSEIKSPQGQDIPREQRDHHTPEQENVLKKLEDSAKPATASGWGWGWGSSLLSAASTSVQTFTKEVGDGLTTIMDTVESSLGVPDPSELARVDAVKEQDRGTDTATVTAQPEEVTKSEKPDSQTETEKLSQSNEEKVQCQEKESTENVDVEKDKTETEKNQEKAGGGGGGGGWFASWGVGDIAKKVQNTGKSLASKGQSLMSDGFDAMENLAAGGIDVLETIGKKTYDTLSERDPAFRKTREYLLPKSNKPNLSQMLREAKDKAEMDAAHEKENEEARKAHFGALFDDYQGIAHLEALEMLSNQSEKKVHSLLNSLSSEDLAGIKPMLIGIKQAFELEEEDEEGDLSKEQDFSSLVSQHLSDLKLGTAPDKLNKVHDMVKQWIVDFDTQESHEGESTKSVHQRSIQALAELTSKGVEQFHKAGELVLLQKDADKDCTERAHSLARLTSVLCHEIGNMTNKFVTCLHKMEQGDNKDEVTPLVTNVYLEATNSSTYIQDAFQLLLPVLQQAAIEHIILSRQS